MRPPNLSAPIGAISRRFSRSPSFQCSASSAPRSTTRRANAARSAMQAALDTAALMVSKDAAAEPHPDGRPDHRRGAEIFQRALSQQRCQRASASPRCTRAKQRRPATVSGHRHGIVATDFMKIGGLSPARLRHDFDHRHGATPGCAWPWRWITPARWPTTARCAAMQKAAKEPDRHASAFSKEAGDVYISIVPFARTSTSVNVGNYIKWSSPPTLRLGHWD